MARQSCCRRIIKKAPKQARRKDDGKKNVIINQRKNKKLNSKLIDQVPYPYTNPQQLERTIAQPIGAWRTSRVPPLRASKMPYSSARVSTS